VGEYREAQAYFNNHNWLMDAPDCLLEATFPWFVIGEDTTNNTDTDTIDTWIVVCIAIGGGILLILVVFLLLECGCAKLLREKKYPDVSDRISRRDMIVRMGSLEPKELDPDQVKLELETPNSEIDDTNRQLQSPS
jgi:hypothetical protein